MIERMVPEITEINGIYDSQHAVQCCATVLFFNFGIIIFAKHNRHALSIDPFLAKRKSRQHQASAIVTHIHKK